MPNQSSHQPLKYYHQFREIQGFLVRITQPYIFTVASIGLISNTFTVLLLATSCMTKNFKHKWTLIALGMYSEGELSVEPIESPG